MVNLETAIKRAVLNDEAGPRTYTRLNNSITTAGAVTYTAAQVLAGRINRDPNGAGRSDTLPTVSLFMAALRGKASEMGVQLPRYVCVEFIIQNDASGAYTITLLAGTGGSLLSGHTTTVAQSNSRRYEILFDTLQGSESYVVRNLGGYTT